MDRQLYRLEHTFHLFIHHSIHLCIHNSIDQFQSIHPSNHQSFHPSIIYLSIHCDSPLCWSRVLSFQATRTPRSHSIRWMHWLQSPPYRSLRVEGKEGVPSPSSILRSFYQSLQHTNSIPLAKASNSSLLVAHRSGGRSNLLAHKFKAQLMGAFCVYMCVYMCAL